MAKIILICLLAAAVAYGQTLNVADTSGKGKLGMFVASNALVIRDFTTAAYSWSVLTYGVNDRVDIYAGAAATTLLGQIQTAAMAGWNVNILKKKWISISNFTLVTTPLHKRAEASEAVVFTSAVVSRSFKRLTPYAGYSATIPVGDKQTKLYTPAATVHNIPLGVMIPMGKWALFTEYNWGREVQTAGVGLAYSF